MPRTSALVAYWLVWTFAGCSDNSQTHTLSPAPLRPTTAAPEEIQTVSRQVVDAAVPEAPAIMAEELAQAKQQWSTGNRNFVHRLNKLKASLVTLTPATENHLPVWEKVTLNRLGAGFDAIRLDVPYNNDMLLVYAKPEHRRIWWVFCNPKLPDHEYAVPTLIKQNLNLPEIGYPDQNVVVFQQYDTQQFRNLDQCFLAFGFDDAEPMDVYFKTKYFERHLKPPGRITKPHDAAPLLGIEVPFHFSKLASAADRAQDALELNGLKAALEMLDKEVSSTTTRRDKLYYAKLSQQMATQLAKKRETRKEANPHFLKSAEMWRGVLTEDGSLEFEDREQSLWAFYNEACAFAQLGKPADAMRCLQQAVDRGFSDGAWIRGDDDLEPLHELPEFKQLVKELTGK